jgi:bifunctional non-homologous end joining protein LigD
MAAHAKLREYRRKRDFDRTPEPAGKARARIGRSFVVQKHAASHLHYDFRLELDGVLKSWAIPKGPSLDPADKRLAMQTEDHPVEYGDFEGIIPEGEYGGGTVLLWDRGTWTPLDDPHVGLRKGRLTFVLSGEKLRGRWHLVRLAGRDRDRPRSWMLIKSGDDEARRAASQIVVDEPASVASGRRIEEIAADRDRVWRSNHATEPVRPSSQRPPAERTKRARESSAGERGADRPRPPSRPRSRPTPQRRPRTTAAGTAVVAGVELTHADRVLYPVHGLTKLGLAAFYESIAEWILPHLVSRPTTLVRCPEGMAKPCFYQKHTGWWAPPAVRRVRIQEKRKVGEYLVVDDLPALIGLVQLGILEIHTWNSRVETLEQPDRVVFDLDPADDVPWAAVVAAAQVVRERLQRLGLESFVKTTGGKGLHVVAPLVPGPDWPACATFARTFAEALEREAPDAFISTMSKARRRGRIFIDHLRNVRGSTSVAAYSTRAREHAPVSTPLAWDELDARMRSDRYTVVTLGRRLRSLRADPWARYWKLKQRLPTPSAAGSA